MTREQALMLMSCRLYALLGLMFSRWRRWRAQTDYPRCSAGFNSGGSVSEFEDLEDDVDRDAVLVLEAGWDGLTPAEKIMVEQAIGLQPWVWTARPGVLESAIAKLERKLRTIGAA